ncbi:MAG: Tyrosine-protein phosphatase YwqE [Syntrophus sp. SKADARSKE-3]|nr:Tyrosine-protein phosphatase YwqE [Syntrophus sp. SKADARSKE-3]
MIDLHSHILPNLDDGASDWAQALAMARAAAADGITDVVCTPHWVPGKYDNTRSMILERMDEYRTHLAKAGIHLRLHPGAELRLDFTLPARIKSGELLTIGDGGIYVLIELPDGALPEHLEEFFWELELQRIKPIFSHVERNAVLHQDPSRLCRWVEMGYLVQVTAASLAGGFTKEIRGFVQLLLEHRMVHILASDSHGLRTRAPNLSEGLAVAGEIIGIKAAKRMVSDIPACVLRGETVNIPDPIPIQKKKSFFDFFRH